MSARSRVPLCAACVLAAAALLSLSSCKSAPQAVPADLSPAEYFQRAQDAAEKGDFSLALRYYQSFQERFPDDVEHGAWASYEIGFLYHKMGNNKKCMALLDDLLARYAKGEKLPDAPRILAQRVKTRLQAEAASAPAAAPAPASAPEPAPTPEPTPAPAPAS